MVSNFKERFQAKAEDLASRGARALEKLPPLGELISHVSKLKYPVLAVLGFLSADLLLQIGSEQLVKKAGRPRPSAPREESEKPYVKNITVYDETIKRNSFCPGCPVPDIISVIRQRPKDCAKAKVFQNAASLRVIGTIVLSDPTFSVATVTLGSGDSKAIKKGDPVEGFGTVFEIRRDRICFEKSDGFLGYVDIPEEKTSLGQPLANALPTSNYEGIQRVSDNEVEIKRSFLIEKLNDPNVLFQANAVPYKDPVTGQMKGFKILSIVPGSVYEAMDIRGEDIIVEVNGEPMNALSKAQELYSSAASADTVTIGFLRGGQPITKTYKVK